MLQALPYINEALILLSALCIALGWWFIKKNRVQLHKWCMILGVVLAALFFIGYASKTFLVGSTSFSGASVLRAPYQIFLTVHSILATIAAVLGLLALRFVYKRRFSNHAKIGRITAPLWFVTAGTGLVVFLMLYVIFPPGPNMKVFQFAFLH